MKTRLLFAVGMLAILCLSVGVAYANGGPHGSYSATTDACAACHRVHTGSGTRLLTSSTQGNAFCYACHDGTGAALSPIVSTHSNADASSSTEPAIFALDCAQCHEPHGSSNLYTIRKDIRVTNNPIMTTGPVVFSAFTGADSFDEGGDGNVNTDDICVTCHINPSNFGFPMTNHDGGANHGGGMNYEGQNCTDCHGHDQDGDPNTRDGFMPVGGGSCTGCHASVQDNGDGIPAGGRRAVVGEFGAVSHHVQGSVQDSDCTACHDITHHSSGNVEVYNADDPTAVYTLLGDPMRDPVEAERIEAFCLACHDPNGANGSAPFADNIMPPVVDSLAWYAASHNGGTGTCYGCHNNGHGSVKRTLLGPWDNSDGGLPDDPLREAEGFCYNCHDADGPATTNIKGQFDLPSHHRVVTSEQQVSGAKEVNLECVNCHNPHTVTSANKVSNPDNTDSLASNNTSFCLTCHDGAPPAGVAFGAYPSTGFGWNKSAYTGSAHQVGDAARPDIQCQNCHESHGSNANYNPNSGDPTAYADLLKGRYEKNYREGSYPNGFALCWTCHDSGLVLGSDNAFGDLHSKHDEESTCIFCHDTHNAYDAGEPGLVNFSYGATHGNLTLQYRSDGSEIDVITDFSSAYDRNGSPQCGITCHGKNHGPMRFSPNPIDTTP